MQISSNSVAVPPRPQPGEGPAVADVLRDLVRHPIRHYVHGWNWKSAATSASCRAAIFLTVNLPAGWNAGLRAMAAEIVFRVIASGVLGSATQAFRIARPTGIATATALVILPATGHLAEYGVHRLAGTVRLDQSIAVSVAFSVLTTAFNLFAMRRGVLVVGPGQQSFAEDLRALPSLVAGFIAATLRAAIKVFTRLWRHGATCLSQRCT